MTTPDIPPVNVRIIDNTFKPPSKVRNIKTSYSQVTLVAGTNPPQMVLGHAPNRIRAFIQITTGQCFLAEDQNSVKKQDNACANLQAFAGGFYVLTTNEMWVGGNVVCNLAVIQEFQDDCEC